MMSGLSRLNNRDLTENYFYMKHHNIVFPAVIVLAAVCFISLSKFPQIPQNFIWGTLAILTGVFIFYLLFPQKIEEKSENIARNSIGKTKKAIANAKERKKPDEGPVQRNKKGWF